MSYDQLLTRRDVEKRCQIARTTIYRLMRTGQFPEPIRIGPRAVRWPESEVEAWLASRPTGDRRAGGDGGTLIRRTEYGTERGEAMPRRKITTSKDLKESTRRLKRMMQPRSKLGKMKQTADKLLERNKQLIDRLKKDKDEEE